jgi:hypothetical protein
MPAREMTPAQRRGGVERELAAKKLQLQRAASRLLKGDPTAQDEVDRCKANVKTLQALLEDLSGVAS